MSNIKDVCCKLVSVKWSIASLMSSKLEPVIWLRVLVTLAYMKGRTDVRTYVRTYVVRTDVHDVMAIKPNFLTSMGYHIFLTMVLRARAPSAPAELRYYGNFIVLWQSIFDVFLIRYSVRFLFLVSSVRRISSFTRYPLSKSSAMLII